MNYIASGQKNPEQIDKSLSEHDQIKHDVQQLKASIENFNKEMDDFDKEKKDLAKEIIEQKKEEFEKKKQEIEQKKKETKEHIQRLKKEIKENKTTDIDSSLVKLDIKINEELDDYSKELDALSIETGFWGKIKETGNKVWSYAKENPGKTALIASGIGLAIWGISKLFKKKEKKEGDDAKKEEKPGFFKRALKWGAGIFGGVMLWRNWGDIKNLWNRLFNGERDQKDKFGKELCLSLGKDRSYDEAGNVFIYKSKKYTWDVFYKENLIYTKMDADGKLVLDISKSVEQIREYVRTDTDQLPNKHNVTDFEKYCDDWSNLDVTQKNNYYNVENQISSSYKNLYNDDLDFSFDKYNIDKGFLLFHLDQSFDNIGTMLNKNSFNLFLDSSTQSMIESIFKYFPDFIISAILSSAKALNIVGLEKFAEDTSNLGDFLKNLQPAEINKFKDLCLFFYNQSTAVCYYALTVRDSYIEKVGGDADKISEFETKKLRDLDIGSVSDLDIKSAIESPKMEKDISKTISKLNSRQEKMLEKLDKADTLEEQKKVMERLIYEIDDVGYHTWNSSLSMIWGHIFEKKGYIEYDIISKMYDPYFAEIRGNLNVLLKKNPLTESDKQQIKKSIEDFYSTMKLISTQVELRQETDENGNLFTVCNFPLVRGGKTIFQTFMLYKEDGKYILAGGTVGAALLAGDILTWAPRKVLALRKVLVGKSPIVRLSPTDWVVRKITNGTLGLLGYSAAKTGDLISRGPIRIMNQKLNQSKLYRSISFKEPKDLFDAVNKGHIRLKDAATMLAGKSSGKTLSGIKTERFAGKKWRKLGFGTDVAANMKKLLQHNTWVMNNVGVYNATTANKYDLLIKYWDVRKVRIARIRSYNSEKLVQLFLDLSKGNLSPLSFVDKTISNLGKTPEEISSKITKLQSDVTKHSKDVFSKFEQELTKEASKKSLIKGSAEYEKLSKKIRDSSSYGRKLEGLVAFNNEVIMKAEEKLMKQFNKASWAKKQILYANNVVVKKIVLANGGIEKWKIPAFGRTGRIVSVGIHAVMLGWIGSGKDESGNKKDWGKIGGEAADFGLGMIPIAGGVYDIGIAFRGKDLNGRQMGTGERWFRGAVGLGTGVLDVVTFGFGGTAIRAGIKGGTKFAIKAGTKTVAQESVKIVSKGLSKGAAKQLFKSSLRNIIIGTTAGLVLVPVAGGIRDVIFSDDEDNDIGDIETDDKIDVNYNLDDDIDDLD